MSEFVQCPGCPTKFRTRPEQLGRVGRCVRCGLLFRLVSPVGERLDEEGPDTPVVIEEPRPRAAIPLPDDDDEPPVERRRPKVGRERTWVLPTLLAAFALMLCGGCGVGGFFLLGKLDGPEQTQGETEV